MKAYLGLGSNVGDRLAHLQRAVDLLGASDEVWVLRSSRVYETEAVGPPQPDFLNAVIEVTTSLAPLDLLDRCLEVEDEMGRVRTVRWGPRVIDVDLLTYGRQTVDLPDLTVPHPRMHQRLFVLAPLLELDGDPSLPGGRRVSSLRLESDGLLGVRLVAPSLRIPEPVPRPGDGHPSRAPRHRS